LHIRRFPDEREKDGKEKDGKEKGSEEKGGEENGCGRDDAPPRGYSRNCATPPGSGELEGGSESAEG
jgi:hypothetical protein